MSIAQVITYGFGSFGDVNKIPTHGFSIGSAPIGTTPDGLDYHVSNNRPHCYVSSGRPHYHVSDNRPHYEVQ